MIPPLQPDHLLKFGLTKEAAQQLANKINTYLLYPTPEQAWQAISKKLLTPKLPFDLHLFIFKHLYPAWPEEFDLATAWIPEHDFVRTTNLMHAMAKLKMPTYREFHAWSVNHYVKYWEYAIKLLKIVFQKPPEKICDLSEGVETPEWLSGSKLNIVESCFTTPGDKTAIIFKSEKEPIQRMTYDELDRLSNRIANSLVKLGFKPCDVIAINTPMTPFAVAIYLGIIKMGGVVASIADSFSREEVATRLRIANANAIFTQDFIFRNAKHIPLYEKIVDGNAPLAIVLPNDKELTIKLRPGDLSWTDFLDSNDTFKAHGCYPMQHCNILFSSGTTTDPKAIPWNHTTPIKVAIDAYFHQNIKPDDILAWPTNLGWMMGPWLIFAALMNHATLALYDGNPSTKEFGKFIEEAKVTMLGVFPTLVASWRQSHCMEGLNWETVQLFSSTGECSNPEDMLYLMSLAHYKPIIEYCGGTEIGGAYITSTVIENVCLSLFSTPALGSHFQIINPTDPAENCGEVALIPPSMGLSTELLNANHHQVYFADMPKTFDGKCLRRHGDQIQKFANGYYSVLGRSDDTMKLGAIKVSSAEIERVISGIQDIKETAAIGVPIAGSGPCQLIVYAVTDKNLDKEYIKNHMQKKISQSLNPLFKIHDIVFIQGLPKTASNKVMRRMLRKHYLEKFL